MLRRARSGQTGWAGTFERGIDLNAAFYAEVVAPILGPTHHSAGLLGWGSEILGFDTARSTDHGWGPRLRVFVDPSDVAPAQAAPDAALPSQFRTWPVRYGWDAVVAEHRVRVSDLGSWLTAQLGRDPRGGIDALGWLVMPQQLLLGVVRGAVFHDGLGDLRRVREQLGWYPDDVWRWMVACQWQRVAQEEAFVGRTAEVGDELGSRLVAARQVHELMRLWFLLHRQYWPYMKWFGSAFARLPGAAELAGYLDRVQQATDWPARQRALAASYEFVARGHNAAGITEWVDPTVRPVLRTRILGTDERPVCGRVHRPCRRPAAAGLAPRWFGRPTRGLHRRAFGRPARRAPPCVVRGRTCDGCPRRSGLLGLTPA